MSIPLDTIYSYFKTGKFPTQTQFQDSWSSFWHKGETNIATVDDYDELGNISEFGNVYNKTQSNDQFMSLSDFVNNDQKILAEKIEALGLTTLIEAVETTISQFADHSGSYEFENNDFIAIPDNNGNFSLYMFKGGAKTDKTNYLPTGISNVTIGMVEGLQAALNTKMNKPSGNGNFFIRGLGSDPVYASISPATNYLLSWNGSDFKESNVYYNTGKLGVGTTSPTEMLHLNNGRVRSKSVVLDENNETLINQITSFNQKLLFTDSTSTKKTVLTVEDLPTEFMTLPSKLTEAQKTTWKTEMNGGFSTASMSVFVINPVVIKKQNGANYISLRGANLNFNPANFQVDIVDMGGNVVLNVPNSQIQLISTGLDLIFWVNLFSLPFGSYKVKLRNGLAEYTTTVNFQLVDNVNSIDPSTLLWNTKVYQDIETTKMYASGNTVHYAIDGNVKAYADEAVFLFKAKTQQPIFSAGEDFYFEFDVPALWVNGNTSSNFFGLSVISDYKTLNNDIIGGVALGVRGDYLNWVNFTSNTSSLEWNQIVNVILVKRGNTLTRIITAKRAGALNPTTFIDSATIVDGQDLYISAIFQNSTYYTQQKFMEMNIKDMYTF
ncbi:hypothetical protein A0O34_16640 [Chryseobacterium glaciei]|uniref:Uncharacterized protein n=1 Tax=Chryseobacterium glaciei TaxID=1685010 RepID=A0A172XYM7_9FLAO|nr:hypothetical protein [Chryseobacterium glaciei]ANF52041.1 hypothetical protein A0O34_16640 [Chryseobacterium glaciei]